MSVHVTKLQYTLNGARYKVDYYGEGIGMCILRVIWCGDLDLGVTLRNSNRNTPLTVRVRG